MNKLQEVYKLQKGFTMLELTIVLVTVFGIGGWIANIVKLVGMNFSDPITVELVLRAIGIPMIPLGIVMGFL